MFGKMFLYELLYSLFICNIKISFLRIQRIPEDLESWGKSSCFMFTCEIILHLAVGTKIGQLIWFYQNVFNFSWSLLQFYCCLLGLAWFQLKQSSMLGFYLYLLPNAEETRTRAVEFSNKVLLQHFLVKVCLLPWMFYKLVLPTVSQFQNCSLRSWRCSSLPYALSSTVCSVKLSGSKLSTFMAMQRCCHLVEIMLWILLFSWVSDRQLTTASVLGSGSSPSQCSQSGMYPAELSVCVSSALLTPGALS